MRQRNDWSYAEDTLVRDHMTAALANGEPLRDAAHELSHTIPHPTTSILQRWYRVLSGDSERVKGRVDKRVSFNTRLQPGTLAKLKAIADVKGWQQNDTVACALSELVNGLDDATIDAIMQRQTELLEEMDR